MANLHHPEQLPEEIYMGNVAINRLPACRNKSGWKTSRYGKTAIMANGEKYKGSDLRPWFIRRSEVEQEIAKERQSNKHWSADCIKVYEKMLANGKVDIP